MVSLDPCAELNPISAIVEVQEFTAEGLFVANTVLSLIGAEDDPVEYTGEPADVDLVVR